MPINYDEYKNPGEVVRFRIGPAIAFGKGLETDLDGNTVFDILETMGYRNEVYVNDEKINTLTDLELCESPDKGFYNNTDLSSRDEQIFESSSFNEEGLPDYTKLDPNITGIILNGVAPIPAIEGIYLVVGTNFGIYPEGIILIWDGALYNIDSTGRPLLFTFQRQIGNSSTINDELVYFINNILEDIIIADISNYTLPGLYRVATAGNLPDTTPVTIGDIIQQDVNGIWTLWIAPIIFNIETEYGPIFYSEIISLNENVTLYVRNFEGAIRSGITLSITNFNDLDTRLDRTNSDLRRLKKQTLTINVTSGTIQPGDTIWIRYKHFTHTDVLRDRSNLTLWKTKDGITDAEFIIDMSVNGGVLADFPYNNLHLIAHKCGFPTGATNYIIYTGAYNSSGQLQFKVHASGELKNIISSQFNVIKFNDTDAKFLKINLFNPQNSQGFVAVTIANNDPLLKSLDFIGLQDDIDYDDFNGLSIIPYYHDKSNTITKGNTITLGEEIKINEIVANGIGRAYIPRNFNGNIETKDNYLLAYYNIQYNSEVVYKGIIPDKNSNSNEVISINPVSISGTKKAEIDYDIIIPRTNGLNRLANTKFNNIINSPVDLNNRTIQFTVNLDNLKQSSIDYFEDGRIIITFVQDNGSYANVFAKILSHNGADDIMSGSPGQVFGITANGGTNRATNPFVKVLSTIDNDDNNNFVIAWIRNNTSPVSQGIFYSISSKDGIDIGQAALVPGQSSVSDSANPKIATFKNGGLCILNTTIGDLIELCFLDNTEDQVTNPLYSISAINNIISNVDTTKDYKIIELNNNTFLVIYIHLSGEIRVAHFNNLGIDVGANDFDSATAIDAVGINPQATFNENGLVVISYEQPAGTLKYRIYNEVGVPYINEISILSGIDLNSGLLFAPDLKNIVSVYRKSVSPGFYFKYIELFKVAIDEFIFTLSSPLDIVNDTVYLNNTLLISITDYKFINNNLILNISTTANDIISIIRNSEITIVSGSGFNDFTANSYKSLGDDFIFSWVNTSTNPDTINYQTYNQNWFDLYWVNLSNNVEQRMVPGTGFFGEYIVNKKDGIVIFYRDGVSDTFQPDGSTGENFLIKAYYNYKLYSQSLVYPQRYILFLGSRLFPKFIGYSEMRVYPSHWFADYLPNDDFSVDRFPINPESEDVDIDTGSGIIKLINNTQIRDSKGEPKLARSYSGPKISFDFAERLKYWHQHNEELILVDDMRVITKGFMQPNSLKIKRRRTTESEQNQESGSYSFSFIFQES